MRVARFHDNQRLAGTADNLVVDDSVLRQTENVTVGDTASVVRFIRNFGSHYIASYITGNSLYQVINLNPSKTEETNHARIVDIDFFPPVDFVKSLIRPADENSVRPNIFIRTEARNALLLAHTRARAELYRIAISIDRFVRPRRL